MRKKCDRAFWKSYSNLMDWICFGRTEKDHNGCRNSKSSSRDKYNDDSSSSNNNNEEEDDADENINYRFSCNLDFSY